MMKFSYQFEENSALTEMTLNSESSLSDVLLEFEHFLLSAGYSFDGHVEIYNEENDV